jgi:hypothetical protein
MTPLRRCKGVTCPLDSSVPGQPRTRQLICVKVGRNERCDHHVSRFGSADTCSLGAEAGLFGRLQELTESNLDSLIG